MTTEPKYIPYQKALQELQDRFNASEADMVAWIYTNKLKAYWEQGGSLELFSFFEVEQQDDSRFLLDTLLFEEAGVNIFKPDNRYIYGQHVINSWFNRGLSSAAATVKLIQLAFNAGWHPPLHPLDLDIESRKAKIKECIFLIGKIEEYEKRLFPKGASSVASTEARPENNAAETHDSDAELGRVTRARYVNMGKKRQQEAQNKNKKWECFVLEGVKLVKSGKANGSSDAARKIAKKYHEKEINIDTFRQMIGKALKV